MCSVQVSSGIDVGVDVELIDLDLILADFEMSLQRMNGIKYDRHILLILNFSNRGQGKKVLLKQTDGFSLRLIWTL
jgi:hypothetical protein